MKLHDTPNGLLDDDEIGLFRKEAIAAREQRADGPIIMARAVPLQILTIACALSAALVVGFVCIGHVNRREHVTGQLSLNRQTAKIYSPTAGVVLKRLVNEGDMVAAGQPLYVISSDLRSTARGSTGKEVVGELSSRRNDRIAERDKQKLILNEQLDALRQKLADLIAQQTASAAEENVQVERVRVNSLNLARLQELAKEGYLPIAQLSEREQDNLDQRARLQSLRSQRLALQTQINSNRNELSSFPLVAHNQISAINREITELEQDIAETEGKREIVVASEISGLVTACLVDAGQYVTSTALLVNVVPQGARLVARLNVPSSAVGFIRAGTIVLLRYDAFPYQKFGQYSAAVTSVSRTALQPGDLQMLDGGREGYYRVAAELGDQEIQAFGLPMPLQDGMKFQADVLLERRAIYEWILEPLYTISGRLDARGISGKAPR